MLKWSASRIVYGESRQNIRHEEREMSSNSTRWKIDVVKMCKIRHEYGDSDKTVSGSVKEM